MYSFLLVVMVSLISFLFIKDGSNKSKNLQKIIGGLSVFIIAIISQNGWVFSLSVFVGGLIIASEDFMKFFAAIMKTSGDKVPETIDALNASKASTKDIDKKIEEEGAGADVKVFGEEEGGLEVTHCGDKLKMGSNDRVNERIAKIKIIEEQLQPILATEFGKNYESNMKITKGKQSLVVDGLIRKKNKIRKVVEIKYISKESFPAIKYLIARIREKLAKMDISRKIMLVIVSETMTVEIASNIRKENWGLAILWFFKFADNKVYPILTKEEFVIPSVSESSEV